MLQLPWGWQRWGRQCHLVGGGRLGVRWRLGWSVRVPYRLVRTCSTSNLLAVSQVGEKQFTAFKFHDEVVEKGARRSGLVYVTAPALRRR